MRCLFLGCAQANVGNVAKMFPQDLLSARGTHYQQRQYETIHLPELEGTYSFDACFMDGTTNCKHTNAISALAQQQQEGGGRAFSQALYFDASCFQTLQACTATTLFMGRQHLLHTGTVSCNILALTTGSIFRIVKWTRL